MIHIISVYNMPIYSVGKIDKSSGYNHVLKRVFSIVIIQFQLYAINAFLAIELCK